MDLTDNRLRPPMPSKYLHLGQPMPSKCLQDQVLTRRMTPSWELCRFSRKSCRYVTCVALSSAESLYVQSFGATLGLPLQGFSPNQEIPSNNATGGRQQMSSPLRDNSGRREFGVAAAAARELAQQTGSKPGGGDSHRDSPASMISLPASKTAKGKDLFQHLDSAWVICLGLTVECGIF